MRGDFVIDDDDNDDNAWPADVCGRVCEAIELAVPGREIERGLIGNGVATKSESFILLFKGVQGGQVSISWTGCTMPATGDTGDTSDTSETGDNGGCAGNSVSQTSSLIVGVDESELQVAPPCPESRFH